MRDCNNITVFFISQSPKNVTIAMEECGEPHCFTVLLLQIKMWVTAFYLNVKLIRHRAKKFMTIVQILKFSNMW